MRIVTTWNLRDGADAAAFEEWLLTEALPGIRALPSVDELQVYRTTGLLGTDGAAPFRYVEVLDVFDTEGFGRDITSEGVAAINARLRAETEGMAAVTTEELTLAARAEPAG